MPSIAFDKEVLDKLEQQGYSQEYLIHLGASAARYLRTSDLFYVFEKKAVDAEAAVKKLPEFTKNLQKELEELISFQLPSPKLYKVKETPDEKKEKAIQDYLSYQIIEYDQPRTKRYFKLFFKTVKDIPKKIRKQALPLPTFKMIDEKIIISSESTIIEVYKKQEELENLYSSYFRVSSDRKIRVWQQYLKYLAEKEKHFLDDIEILAFLTEMEKVRRHDQQVVKFTHEEIGNVIPNVAIITGATEKHEKLNVRRKKREEVVIEEEEIKEEESNE